MFPPSVTLWPSASRRASRPATRTADGPMSTPRREAPRSRGTPMMQISRGGSVWTPLCEAASVSPILDIGRSFIHIPSGCGTPGFFQMPGAGEILRINPVECPGKGNRLAHVLQTADPRHRALNPHSETGVRYRTIPPQIQIPLESIHRQVVLFNALLQQVKRCDALRSANDLAIAFRC